MHSNGCGHSRNQRANWLNTKHTDGDTRLIMKWVKGPQPKKSSDTVTKVVKSL